MANFMGIAKNLDSLFSNLQAVMFSFCSLTGHFVFLGNINKVSLYLKLFLTC